MKTKRKVAITHSASSMDRLNAVCPYFTMFPIAFPRKLLAGAHRSDVVLDPFCGRGTSNYAARERGMLSYGIDTSPVAVAIARAKLVNTTFDDVMQLAWTLLNSTRTPAAPRGTFWRSAYHQDTLNEIVRIRHGLLSRHQLPAATMLRAIMLGCLHGPLPNHLENAGYFSNQMPRTYAPKPAYSVRYWKNLGLVPPRIPALIPIQRKAAAIFVSHMSPSNSPHSSITLGDSRSKSSYRHVTRGVSHIITSPPYYGLRTYLTDQWMRNWFLGGEATVPYGGEHQLSHASPREFATSLSKVWNNCGEVLRRSGRLIIRFGAIGSRDIDPRVLIDESLSLSEHSWSIYRTVPVRNARPEKRQAHHMGTGTAALREYDFFVKPT